MESMSSIVKNTIKTYNIITVNRKHYENLMQMKSVVTYTYTHTHNYIHMHIISNALKTEKKIALTHILQTD